MRLVCVFGLAGVLGCGGEGFCGLDTEGEDVPICEYEVPDLPETLLFCPGDHWGAADACNSCGCDSKGNVLCTAVSDCAAG